MDIDSDEYYSQLYEKKQTKKSTLINSNSNDKSNDNNIGSLFINNITLIVASIYLWILFGMFGDFIGCSMKKKIKENIFVKHVLFIFSIFLLFTVISDTTDPVYKIYLQTILLYGIYLLLSKIPFAYSIIVIFLLFIDQSINAHISNITNNNNDVNIDIYNNIRKIILYIFYSVIAVGFITYTAKQYIEFGSEFSFYKLFFTFTCKE